MTAPDNDPVDAIIAAIMSHAQALGVFRATTMHEPKSAPPESPTLAYWMSGWEPVRGSGLSSVSVRLEFSARVYMNFKTQPEDQIDPLCSRAARQLMRSYARDFDLTEYATDGSLDGVIRMVDLLGVYGNKLSARAGYLDQDGTKFRAMVITLPLIINDLWDEGEG